MDMIGKVRRMKLRDQLTHSEIARRTGLSRNTVKKWLKADSTVEPKYRRRGTAKVLKPFEPTLVAALKADALRPREQRRTARALLLQLQAQGYRGSYSTLTEFIRDWKAESGKSTPRAFVPLSFEFGEAFQFDWSEEGIMVGGVYYRAQVAHLKLCASKAFWLVAYPSQGHEMLFDAHTRAFAALGGVPRRGIYDNMKTAVDMRCPTFSAFQPVALMLPFLADSVVRSSSARTWSGTGIPGWSGGGSGCRTRRCTGTYRSQPRRVSRSVRHAPARS